MEQSKEEAKSSDTITTVSLTIDLQRASEKPAKIAEVLARVFYKELRRHGFTDQQVIKVASELIACLSTSLEGYKRKLQQEGEREQK